jgi:multidrug efflux pump subunit AcrB
MVVDDFGDVYGVFLAITGEGYSQQELRRYAEFLRRELLLATDVKKVDLFSEQQELVYLEISRQRLARLGLNEDEIYAQLQARNVVADGGRVQVGDEHLALDPKGGFSSADEMLELVVGNDAQGRQLVLRDVATIERADRDPPRRILKYDGMQAIGLGISTVQGGNVVTMGQAVRQKLDELKRNQPLGIEIEEINFQPEAVTAATGDFIFNLIKAVSIVIIVLMFAMGLRTGLIIGMVLFLTIMATFLVMYLDGDISHGADLARRADHRPLHAHRQRDHHYRGDQGRHRGRSREDGSRPRGGDEQPVVALRGDGDRRDRLRGDRALERQHGRVLQLAFLGDLHLADAQLDLGDHDHSAA